MSQFVEFERGENPARLSTVEHPGMQPSVNAERRRTPRVNGLHLFICLAVGAAVTIMVNNEAAKLDEPTLSNLVSHFAAWPGCDAATAVGVDQARRGAPGYWLDHDRDRDGIACEPLGESQVFFQR
jgi:hypothetical protein